MAGFDYATEAGLFSAKSKNFGRKGLEYRRFERAADAIRFAIEVLPSNALGGCALEVDDERIVGRAIRGLYESADFLWPGNPGVRSDPADSVSGTDAALMAGRAQAIHP